MPLKSVSAIMLIIAGLAVIAFETSIYGAVTVEASPSVHVTRALQPKTKSRRLEAGATMKQSATER
jgi:hypothetical protein